MSAKKSLSDFMGGVTVFEKLTLVCEVEPWRKGKEVKRRGLFRCECGNEKEIDLSNVRKGMSQSCGCNRKISSQKSRTHGMCRTPEYDAWCGMKRRCYSENEPCYKDWGGRGITVCDRWKNSFENFYSDMGARPSKGMSIDRIDVNGNYEPSNCRWASRRVQANNRRNSLSKSINGYDVTLADFAAEMGMKYHTVYNEVVTKGRGLEALVIEMQQKLSKYISH